MRSEKLLRKFKALLLKDLLKRQGGRCAICNSVITRGFRFHLDHDHQKGGLRGALCVKCNVGLGSFCDSPELLKRAIEYLKIPRIARFPRLFPHQTQSEAGKANIKKAARVAWSLPRTAKQLTVIRKAGRISFERSLERA